MKTLFKTINDVKLSFSSGCFPEGIEYIESLNKGMIDNSFQEIDLSGFMQDNPNLINDLKRKYSI